MKILNDINPDKIKDLPKILAIMILYAIIHYIFLFPSDNKSQSVEFLLVLGSIFAVLIASEEKNMLNNLVFLFFEFLFLEILGFYSENVFSLIPAMIS